MLKFPSCQVQGLHLLPPRNPRLHQPPLADKRPFLLLAADLELVEMAKRGMVDVQIPICAVLNGDTVALVPHIAVVVVAEAAREVQLVDKQAHPYVGRLLPQFLVAAVFGFAVVA